MNMPRLSFDCKLMLSGLCFFLAVGDGGITRRRSFFEFILCALG